MPLCRPAGVLTPAETEALRSVIARPRDRAAISLMLDAGLRASEVVSLTLENIEWENQVLRFTGKGNKPAEPPISTRLRETLEKAIQARPPQAAHPYLIYDLKNPGKPITRFALLKLVKTYARRAGIQKRVFCHMLRHTFGTMFFRETGDLGRTQAAMRHTRIATTTIYMHLTARDQRQDFERIDTRSWLLRWWSRLKPTVMPSALTARSQPIYIGETIGRTREISQLRQGVRNRVHTILVGERGVGRRHLLRHLDQDAAIYRLEMFSPARECLVTLCRRLQAQGILAEMPTGRSDTAFLDVLCDLGKAHRLILVIDSLDDLTKKESRNLRKLSDAWTIVTTIDRNRQHKLAPVFFGHYQRIDVENFDSRTAALFTRQAMGDLRVQDASAYLRHIYAQSRGNPQAILELIDATRKTGEMTPTHAVMQQVLPASFFLAVFFMVGFVARYSASALSEPALRIYALIFIIFVLVLMAFDRILKAKA